eukprot:TRINITY_DN4509_c0_g2_i1.p1 TRINITY_DN4509_c0_g2~~TRINITY_DN4509_c0_g2_i1.p1  ORF type:complete len:1046 (-),score=147.14 TRINITY_DN4509_c0_g2_i1:156-3224(-)
MAEISDLESSLSNAEDMLTARSSENSYSVAEETQCCKDLNACVSVVARRSVSLRAQLKPQEKRLKELEREAKQLRVERGSTLKNMAANHLSRVEAPQASVSEVRFGGAGESLLMAVVEHGAQAHHFTALYESVRKEGSDWPEWFCSNEAAMFPEKDLLGMCPGGKPHLSDEKLKARNETKCYCSLCVLDRKLKETSRELEKIRSIVNAMREEIKEAAPLVRKARKILRRLRSCSTDGRIGMSDPVFYDDENPFEPDGEEDGAIVAHQIAQGEWTRLQNTLREDDFPLRLAFLDKSGSMGYDAITYEALQLGLHNCLHPSTGSTLTFLFAGPGETQIVLRRPGDEPLSFEICLGSATWFNEPILRTLTFVAPLVEALDTQQWIARTGQPPLQVFCMTDGADNCSPANLQSLHGLINELKEIVGPVSGQKLYVPISGPVSKTPSLLEETNTKVPVWMAWIATGMGGQLMLQSNVPKEVLVIDAVAAPRFRDLDTMPALQDAETTNAADTDPGNSSDPVASSQQSTVTSRARKRMSAARASETLIGALDSGDSADLPSWNIGHRVRVRASQAGKVPKFATVLRVLKESASRQYELLLDDETESIVDESQLLGVPLDFQPLIKATKARAAGQKCNVGMLSRSADPDMQRLQVLGLVSEVIKDLAAVMGQQDSKTNRLSLERATAAIYGSEEISTDNASQFEDELRQAQSTASIPSVKEEPLRDPTQTLLDAVQATGIAAARMSPEDRLVAQRFVAAGVEMLMYGGSLMVEHLVDQLAPFAALAQEKALRRMRVEPEELANWHQELGRPLNELLQMLVRFGLLERKQTSNGDVLQTLPDARQCLIVLRRFFDPCARKFGMEDSLRRCVNRSQRLRPSFSFSVGKSVSGASASTESPRSGDETNMRAQEDELFGSRPSSQSSQDSSSTKMESQKRFPAALHADTFGERTPSQSNSRIAAKVPKLPMLRNSVADRMVLPSTPARGRSGSSALRSASNPLALSGRGSRAPRSPLASSGLLRVESAGFVAR